MFVVYIGVGLIFISVAASHLEYPISKSCRIGDVAENECNKCTCTPKIQVDVFVCNPKPCNESAVQYDNQLPSCHPNVIYIFNATVCLCQDNGSWPHENCKTIFKSFSNEAKQSCEPGSYVVIDCNVCKCGPDGNLDKKHCTKNICDKNSTNITRRFIQQSQVYGNCEAKNWYSLAPCQFCFCVSENKLVCNTGNNFAQKLQLGSYNLSICGKDLIKDAINLIPDKDRALRLGDKLDNKTESATETITTVITTTMKIIEDSRQSVELNREYNEKVDEQQHDKTANESDEYYSETDEVKPAMPIGREGLSTQSPYGEEDRSESDNEISVPIDPQTPAQNFAKQISELERISQQFRWDGHNLTVQTGTGPITNQPLNLRDVLTPYLPVVLNKVFRMAMRKSMISVDSHSNCTPGSTTTLKCNACFCLKNNKLLCTNTECK